ncbi:MAG: putative LPS assembly protein LptD, partial [Cyclobacteriaceae bacterium]|nr:putative LPS assembly protein LptD [Cyclobacteriaceae bacterium]
IGRGVSKSIGFSLGNTLEMKVKAKQDSSSEASKEKFQKVSLLRSFGLSGSYNMAADSMKLSNISLRGNTSVLNNKLNVSFSGTLDPYTWLVDTMYYDSEKGVRVVKQNQRSIYAIKSGQGLGHISNARLNLSTNFNPKKRQKEAETKDKIQNSQLSEADKDFLLNNPDVYVDFDIPWSLRLSYNINYTRRGYEDPKITQTINGSGDVSLSAKWKVGFTSGYDFKNKDFTQTNITLHRDLHCWELNLSWTPFGRFTSYNFVIRVKSSLLSDLKINRKRSFFDR